MTDRRNPTVNPYGLIFGATELSSSAQPVLDPVHNTKTVLEVPVRDPEKTPSSKGSSSARAAAVVARIVNANGVIRMGQMKLTMRATSVMASSLSARGMNPGS